MKTTGILSKSFFYLLIVMGITSIFHLQAIGQPSRPPDAEYSGTGGYSGAMLDASLMPSSPNAYAFASYGLIPVSLYDGTPDVSIPIYTVKCGSLTLPITLSYNYNGLRPREDASWVGLGWNLNAGGAITRIVQGYVDETRTPLSDNYDQLDVLDSINDVTDRQVFLGLAENGYTYDLEPDIYIYNFAGHSGKFIWSKGKAYTFPYDKLSIYIPPAQGYIRITDQDGTIFTFAATETTTTKKLNNNDPYTPIYISAWNLTQVLSANKKDTINLTYSTPGSISWLEYDVAYNQTYQQYVSGGGGSCVPTTGLTRNYDLSPSISAVVLQSITCNTTALYFSTASRTDVDGNYPELSTIFIDNCNNQVVKHLSFSYDYFGAIDGTVPYERLKLKQLTEFSTNTSETHSYNFHYINEYGNFPDKNTIGIDTWGFYNGQDGNLNLFPASSGLANYGIRSASLSYCEYGALDTIIYPTGGVTSFQYCANPYYGGGTTQGPGIAIKSITSSDPVSLSNSFTRTFFYLNDDGSSSQIVNNTSCYTSYTYNETSGSCSFQYNIFQAPNTGAPGAIFDYPFYYQEVTETDSSKTENHKTNYYYISYPSCFSGVYLNKKVDYLYNTTTKQYQIQKTDLYSVNAAVFDTMFNQVSAWLTTVQQTSPYDLFTYNVTQLYSEWIYPSFQEETIYDLEGNPFSTSTTLYYDSTRNLAVTNSTRSDGKVNISKFKYPEDYSSSVASADSLLVHHVLSPVVEQQSWIKSDASDSLLTSGKIIQYDPLIFKPLTSYFLEITEPLASLNQETKTGNLFNTLVSDSRYVDRINYQYDSYGNLIQQNLTSNINIGYIWDYNHSLPIAQVKNGPVGQIAYTSFETSAKGNWNFSGTPSGSGKTGSLAYSLSTGSISSASLPSGTYVVSYWSSGGSGSVSGGTVTTSINGEADGTGWNYYEYQVVLSSSGAITISGSVTIDELRLYPANGQMTTSTYNPLVGVVNTCTPNNKITFYQYDGFNRLEAVKDQQGNVIKTIKYNYRQ
jgi:hypothetical protein